MKLFHAQYSRSTRVLWALYELSLDADIVSLALDRAALRSEQYLKVNRLGRVPSFEDNGILLHESGAIVEYLAGRYSRGVLAPWPDDDLYPVYLNWLHFGEATLMKDVSTIGRNVFALPPALRSADAVSLALEALRFNAGYLEDRLAGNEYLVGPSFSAADITTGYPLILLHHGQTRYAREDLDLSLDFPAVSRYRDRLLARPAMVAAWARH